MKEYPGFEGLRNWSPPAEPVLSVPTWDEIMGGLSHADWMREAVDGLQTSPSPLDHLASLGMIVRLWMPTERAERDGILSRRMEDPNARIMAFLETIDAETLDGLDSLFTAHLSCMISDAQRDDLREDPVQMRMLMYERDAAESILSMHEHLGRGRGNRDLLDLIDQRMRQGIEVEADDWLAAVYANEPYSWWGRI